jgi:lipopolysaccharide/colanic/teichoic acid biosynthesis glycosyltransferase
MPAYHYDYDDSQSRGAVPQSRAKKEREEPPRPIGIVIHGSGGAGAYYYDLRTRRPIAARIKRAIDVIGAALGILFLAPVFLVIAALIKLTSPGPILFRQRRIGFRCNPFDMYKFRTMVVGAHLKEKELAEQSGGSFLKLEKDPRITTVGAFLRKYSLDELPQLFNVLEGTMSLVGPRPLLMSDLDKLPHRSGLRRFSMLPGCTGLWQVSGRSSCSERRRLVLDRQYVDRWSLALDFQILLRTVEVVLKGQDAA